MLRIRGNDITWGPVRIRCLAHIKEREGRESYVVSVGSETKEVKVYVSKTGRSVRVFREGKELK